jgi:hypothetical protein
VSKRRKSRGIKSHAQQIIDTTKEHIMTKTNAPAKLVVHQPRIMPERMMTQHTQALLGRYDGSMLMNTFIHAVSMRRPHGGAGERNMQGYVLTQAPIHIIDQGSWSWDEHGNLHIDARLMDNGGKSRTLFVAHVDTVHRQDGRNHPEFGQTVVRAGKGAALGADDGSGIAMLMHLMHNNVPGYYLFTVGEECGGVGSTAIARHDAQLLSQFDRAIAFDRRGTSDVITHQSMGRCASNLFAEALSEALNAGGMMYMPCDGGVYTDTAEFVDVIPECTNLSVGYMYEHGDDESQDLVHLCELADAVLGVQWETLPVARDPKVPDPDDYDMRRGWGAYGGTQVSGGYSWVTGKQHDDVYEIVARQAAEDDSEEVALVEALEQVIDYNHTAELERMMVGVVYPEDMALSWAAVQRVMQRMDEDVAYEYIDLVGQYPVDMILKDLFEKLNSKVGA